MKNNGIFCGNPREDKLTSTMVAQAHNAGVKINPWLINEAPVARPLIALHIVSVLFTDGFWYRSDR